jgi:RNA-directed DNA polymerase
MNPATDGCASPTAWTDWNSIDWKKVERGVKSLQSRIVKAIKQKRFHRAKALMHLMSRSFYGKLLAIFRVSSNKGSRTPGVDKVLWNTPWKKWKASELLKVRGYKAKPLRRKSIKPPISTGST